MTQTMILSDDTRAAVRTPEHRLLRTLADFTGPTYYPAQAGASVTQLRALERKGRARLARNGAQVLGVYGLTARGLQHLAALDAAAEHLALIERRVAGDLS